MRCASLQIQRDWTEGALDCVVATIAFGMGAQGHRGDAAGARVMCAALRHCPAQLSDVACLPDPHPHAGIDKADVRWVVHYDPPASTEGYYQESGR